MKNLSLLHQVGQRLVIGLPGTTVDSEFRRLVETYKIANVVLFARNVESKEQLSALTKDIQEIVTEETGYPAFITIDQEGGTVVRLSDDCTNVPGPMALASTGDPEQARLAAEITGRELRALGVNFNLAPSMDINSNPDNPVIGVRSFGDTPEIVSEYSIPTFQELLAQEVMTVGKHFPGHGDTAEDTHLHLPIVDKSMEELEKMELLPFKNAIAAGLPAIMSSHIRFPAIEPEPLPATMSRKVLTDLLRGTMGFQGLVLTDCLEMDAIGTHFGTVKGAVAAAAAGADLVLISHTYSLGEETAIQMKKAVESGEMSAEEMQESVARILDFKNRIPVTEDTLDIVGSETHRKQAASIMEKTITAVNLPEGEIPALGENPLFLGNPPHRPSIASNPADESVSFVRYMVKEIGGKGLETPTNPTAEEIQSIVSELEEPSALVFCTYNGHQATGQLELAKALSKQSFPLIVVALQNPYDLKDLPDNTTTLAAFEYSNQAFAAIKKVLTRERKPTGKLSVSL